jgi:hypothetical protein
MSLNVHFLGVASRCRPAYASFGAYSVLRFRISLSCGAKVRATLRPSFKGMPGPVYLRPVDPVSVCKA